MVGDLPFAMGLDNQAQEFNDPSMSQQVRNKLAPTAHQLSAGNKPQFFHHGPEKKRFGINSVTLAEHLWGIIRIVKDHKTEARIKPDLLSHLEDVVEDSCDYE